MPNAEITGNKNDRFEYYGNYYNPIDTNGRQIEGYAVQKALQQNYYLGFLGTSDTHENPTQPGGSGLTAIYSDSLTRTALIRALKKRHTYAVSN